MDESAMMFHALMVEAMGREGCSCLMWSDARNEAGTMRGQQYTMWSAYLVRTIGTVTMWSARIAAAGFPELLER